MDIMLDIETLATSPDAVVLTFGAIKFDPFDAVKEMAALARAEQEKLQARIAEIEKQLAAKQ